MSTSSALPFYGKSFEMLRQGAAVSWNAYTHHPFVEGMKDGSLPRQSFMHYLVQDYVFLVHFSRAWALAVVKSETIDEMKVAAGTVDALVNHEMQLHIRICAEAGISEEQLFTAREETANLAYTRYVMDAGLSGDFLDLIAALAPCVMGYGEIGLRLKKEANPDSPYMDWIDTYANQEYQDLCANVGAMIDKAVEHRLGSAPETIARWQKIQQQFTVATELEAGFWQMGMDIQG